MSGVDLTTARKRLVRRDIEMTLQYAHLATAQKRKTINVPDSLFTLSTTVPCPYKLPHQTEKEIAFSS
jgi:hypothetical protein